MMKQTKPTPAEVDGLIEFLGVVESLTQGVITDGEVEGQWFDCEDGADCIDAIDALRTAYRDARNWRRVLGLVLVVMDPKNEVIDPDADTVEHHPKRRASEEMMRAKGDR